MKNTSLGVKITMGYALLILFGFALGIMTIWEMNGVGTQNKMLAHEYVPEVGVAMNLRGAANRVMYEMRGYGFTEDEKFYKLAQVEIKAVEKALQLARDLEKRSPNLKKLKSQIQIATNAVDEYKQLIDQTVEINKKLAENRNTLDISAAKYISNASEFLEGQNTKFKSDLSNNYRQDKKRIEALLERNKKISLINDVIGLGNATRIGAFKSQALRNPDLMKNALKIFDKIDYKFIELREITRLSEDLRRIEGVKSASLNYKNAMISFLKNSVFLQELGNKRGKAGQKLIDACKITANAGIDATDRIAKEAVDSLSKSSIVMIIGLTIVLFLGIICAFLITRSITGPVNKIITGLNAGANEVASASQQVSSSSQSMAEGASEQAASIEETSSTMEEMASMTKNNADNSNKADKITKEAGHVINLANTTMGELIISMDNISKASEETSKIIKTIDEIAFQTNLLALNAAVEAARAGEAGAGFAVVADEVRNLAMRAADAAKETSNLIEGTVKKINEGSALVSSTNEAFHNVSESASKVGEIVSEISAASSEQSNGIDQVNKVISEMDQIVQQNAASSEETASASEEMSAQANQLKEYMDELVMVITGKKNIDNFSYNEPVAKNTRQIKTVEMAKNHQIKEISPNLVIPLDDDDFQDF